MPLQAGLEVFQQSIDPAELRQVVGVLASGDNSLVEAVGCGHRPEADQAIPATRAFSAEVGIIPLDLSPQHR